ncbi:MAG: hypothetical protein OXN84_11690, partial [Albidovulum sp.]|nr:hypothetical protein [Albidovulum sp.]
LMLIDRYRFPSAALLLLYFERRQIVEIYTISKSFMAVENFRARSERGAGQDLYASFNLIATPCSSRAVPTVTEKNGSVI